MAPRNPELNRHEVGLFERKLLSKTESDGLLDRAGIAPERFIKRSNTLAEKLKRHTPPRDGFLPRDLLRWHRYIFAPTGLPEVGRFRSSNDHLNPDVGVGIDVINKSRDGLLKVRVPIAEPDDVRARVDAALGVFNDKVPDLKKRPEDLRAIAEAAVVAQTDTYLIHPFPDGNTRTTNLLFRMALYRLCKLEAPHFPGDPEWALARSYALRPDEQRTVEPLIDIVTTRLEDARNLQEKVRTKNR